ncbi:hypothetical protein AYL99_08676 [Fonsecaea erecta]|uniref:Major facilitator superfamily (MFS) profile domain-containing protein n=1 Tax=Fonsecaea erecta TaxID=1367422 RepID=A0A178ZDU6_9EURO|nr:hypothetical protein AYL99_08676 [Fonsecaea erecta]OAP57938.1 hypothetical protein AYL99_08676 [Fonsecaea erecta]
MTSRNTYLAAGIACNTAAMFGYGTGYIGSLLVLPSFNHRFGLDLLSRHALAMTQSLVVSVWLLGALAGVVAALPVCSHLGRKMCLVCCAATYVLGALLQLVPSGKSMAAFDTGRLLNGIGVGAGTLVTPLYISEISRHSQRGMLLGSWQVGIQISALVGFWGGYASHRSLPDTLDLQWEVPVAIQLVPGSILLFGSLVLPESPIWLAERHDSEALRSAIAWLRSQDVSSPEVISEAEEHCQTVMERKKQEALGPRSSTWREIIRPSIRKRLNCGIGLMTLMTLSGTNALNFFAPTIFMSAGFTSTSASLFLTGVFGLVKLAAALSFMFYVVHFRGHRFWIILASAVCSFALFTLAFCVRFFETTTKGHFLGFYLDNGGIPTLPGVLGCIMVLIFAYFFGIGHGPIAWNFCAEVFPAHLSTMCCTITTCTQWLFQVVNAVLTPFLLTTAGWYTWIIFGCVNAFTLIWAILYIPETRGVPLGKQMDALFEDVTIEPTRDDASDETEDMMVVGEETPLLKPQRYMK